MADYKIKNIDTGSKVETDDVLDKIHNGSSNMTTIQTIGDSVSETQDVNLDDYDADNSLKENIDLTIKNLEKANGNLQKKHFESNYELFGQEIKEYQDGYKEAVKVSKGKTSSSDLNFQTDAFLDGYNEALSQVANKKSNIDDATNNYAIKECKDLFDIDVKGLDDAENILNNTAKYYNNNKTTLATLKQIKKSLPYTSITTSDKYKKTVKKCHTKLKDEEIIQKITGTGLGKNKASDLEIYEAISNNPKLYNKLLSTNYNEFSNKTFPGSDVMTNSRIKGLYLAEEYGYTEFGDLYNYYYYTEGEDKANDYLKSIDYILNIFNGTDAALNDINYFVKDLKPTMDEFKNLKLIMEQNPNMSLDELKSKSTKLVYDLFLLQNGDQKITMDGKNTTLRKYMNNADIDKNDFSDVIDLILDVSDKNKNIDVSNYKMLASSTKKSYKDALNSIYNSTVDTGKMKSDKSYAGIKALWLGAVDGSYDYFANIYKGLTPGTDDLTSHDYEEMILDNFISNNELSGYFSAGDKIGSVSTATASAFVLGKALSILPAQGTTAFTKLASKLPSVTPYVVSNLGIMGSKENQLYLSGQQGNDIKSLQTKLVSMGIAGGVDAISHLSVNALKIAVTNVVPAKEGEIDDAVAQLINKSSGNASSNIGKVANKEVEKAAEEATKSAAKEATDETAESSVKDALKDKGKDLAKSEVKGKVKSAGQEEADEIMGVDEPDSEGTNINTLDSFLENYVGIDDSMTRKLIEINYNIISTENMEAN